MRCEIILGLKIDLMNVRVVLSISASSDIDPTQPIAIVIAIVIAISIGYRMMWARPGNIRRDLGNCPARQLESIASRRLRIAIAIAMAQGATPMSFPVLSTCGAPGRLPMTHPQRLLAGGTPAPQWPSSERRKYAGKLWCARLARRPILEGFQTGVIPRAGAVRRRSVAQIEKNGGAEPRRCAVENSRQCEGASTAARGSTSYPRPVQSRRPSGPWQSRHRNDVSAGWTPW